MRDLPYELAEVQTVGQPSWHVIECASGEDGQSGVWKADFSQVAG